MENNAWLNWKLNHGLAARGRPGPLHPRGFLGHLLYHCYFRFVEPKEFPTTDSVQFKQQVGGSLGPVGKTNGE